MTQHLTRHFLFYATPTNKTVDKIWSFLSLPHGWAYGHGYPAAYLVAIYAANVVSLLNSYEIVDTDAFPAEDGSILVTGYIGDHTIEVYCETDGTFEFVVEKDNKEVECVLRDSIAEVWKEIKQRIYLWRRSRDCFTQNTLITQRPVTEVQRSSRLVVAAGHPLLMFPV
jgi:hypothetical protein